VIDNFEAGAYPPDIATPVHNLAIRLTEVGTPLIQIGLMSAHVLLARRIKRHSHRQKSAPPLQVLRSRHPAIGAVR
jgi:hypothetical protein